MFPSSNVRKAMVPVIAAVAMAVILSATSSATIHVVQISNFTFTPKGTTVSPGDTVRWLMVSGVHTTTSDPASPKFWDSGIFPVDETFDVVFEEADGPGPFPYHCEVHPLSMKDTIFVETPPPAFTCGDANNDGSVNVADAVYIINYVFKGGPPPQPVLDSGDANCDGTVNVADAVYLVNFIFKGGPAPCADCP